MKRLMTFVLAVALVVPAFASTGSIAGTAKREVKQPYSDYTVRARDVQSGAIVSDATLDTNAKFNLTGLNTGTFLVELVNDNGKVICTEGPFAPGKSDVSIECGNPLAWLLLAGAGAAGIVAALPGSPASPSR